MYAFTDALTASISPSNWLCWLLMCATFALLASSKVKYFTGLFLIIMYSLSVAVAVLVSYDCFNCCKTHAQTRSSCALLLVSFSYRQASIESCGNVSLPNASSKPLADIFPVNCFRHPS